MAIAEALDRERRVDGMRLVFGNGPGKDGRRTRRRFESTSSPAAIDIQTRDTGFGNDGRTVRRDVDNAAPIAQHLQTAEGGKEFADRLQRMRIDVQRAALRIG